MEQEQKAEDRVPDDLLVALAALHHNRLKLPENLREIEDEATWGSFFADAADADPRGALHRAIMEAIRETPPWPPSSGQWQRFRGLVENMHVH
jgi:hypothetical protein